VNKGIEEKKVVNISDRYVRADIDPNAQIGKNV
jgi:hypothetical protein